MVRHRPATARTLRGAARQMATGGEGAHADGDREGQRVLPVASWRAPVSHGPTAPPPTAASIRVPKNRTVVLALEDLRGNGADDGGETIAEHPLGEAMR